MENLTGKQLGSYQVVAPLGQGGMAAVYKAYQANVDRYVALKILPRHFANDPQFVARFEQEAKVLANLQHPHILPVHDFGEADGYTYIVMPFVQNGTLADLLKGQILPMNQIGRIIAQIGDALDYAHSRGLVHRDIKPSNVLLDERGNCLLTDFGIAKILEGNKSLTDTGGIMGTPAYMSPEQGRGAKVDQRSDLYALGIILYEMVTGRVPYDAETAIAIMIKHINDPLPPPRTLNPALPESMERVILKALAKQPADRFATAGDMVKAITAETRRYDVTLDDKTVVGTPGEKTVSPTDADKASPTSGSQTQKTYRYLALAGCGVLVVVCALAALGAYLFDINPISTSTPIAEEVSTVTASPSPPPDPTPALVTTSEPTHTPEPINLSSPTPLPSTPTPIATVDSFSVVVIVPANSDWVDTGIVVGAGQSLIISGSGGIKLSEDQEGDTNSGGGEPCQPWEGSDCPINGTPYGALLAKISDNKPFEVGSYLETSASANGSLYLAVNDNFCCYQDNSGEYNVTITLTRPAELLAYDNFDDSAFDGAWNEELWTYSADPNTTTIEQNDGVLMISRTSSDVGGLDYSSLKLEDLGFVEAKVMLDGDIDASGGDVGISLWKNDWWVLCGIAANEGGGSGSWAGCWSSDEFKGEWIEVSYHSWHTVRLEVNSDITAMSFFVDGRQVGTYPLPDPEEFKQTPVISNIRVWSGGGPVTGYMDDVKFGQWLATTPTDSVDTIWQDDFSNSAFDGSWNPTLWNMSESSSSEIEQQNGKMILTLSHPQPRDYLALHPIRTQAWSLNHFQFIEAKLLLSSEVETTNGGEGSLGLGLTVPLKSNREILFECQIAREEPIKATCYGYVQNKNDQTSEEFSEMGSKLTSYDREHTVRIEVDSEVNVTFFIDGEQLGSYRPIQADEIKSAIFKPNIWLYSGTENSIKGYLDDIRIGIN